MTLDDAKALLTENKISFELVEYSDEVEYWHHTTLFPYTKNARACKVLAIVIKSNNRKKDIELQFNENNGTFCFEELRFGSFCFEILSECKEETLNENLMAYIREIQEGNWTVIIANNIEKRFWLWDGCFDLNDADDEICGRRAFEEAMLQIQVKENNHKGLLRRILARLLRTKVQYEIYDWNTYQSIIKE